MSLRPRYKKGVKVISSKRIPRLRVGSVSNATKREGAVLLILHQYADPEYSSGAIVELTLDIGAYGEKTTTRGLEIVASRRNQYSGRVEYQLEDDQRNRIDYTRWFKEDLLSLHDSTPTWL
jgi:hypothetical protein